MLPLKKNGGMLRSYFKKKRMRKFKNIYVAATSQHVGKTTSTLGLVSCFMRQGYDVGYCKPVGQQSLNVLDLVADKDTFLFANLINFQIVPDVHSPVILGKGATERYLDDPYAVDLEARILSAERKLSKVHQMVIYEGTGHPGVGSVAELSNAKVARLLNAGVIMIVEGGVGSTIDKLNMSIALFREEGVPILGVIVNKVIPEKIAKVEKYVNIWLKKHNLNLLGVIPYDPTLAYPVIKTICDVVNGTITYNSAQANNKIESTIAGSLIDLKELTSSQDLLLVVSTKSINEAILKIKSLTLSNNIDHCPLSGIVATGQGTFTSETLKYIEENNLPLIRTDLDTYGAVVKISRIEVKINQSTPWKIVKAINLIEDNVDLESIKEAVKI